jgi:mannose-6-phosphate isomerase
MPGITLGATPGASAEWDAVRQASARARRWLRDCAWPLWLAHGIDWERRGFHEHLTLDGLHCRAEFRRLRVVTRQIYVFSEAARAGMPGALAAVELGVDFLRRHARQADGGYAWRFTLDGAVLDNRRDLYDHAFVLLALASAWRVLPEPAIRAEALALDDYLQRHFRHQAGGYVECLPAALPRRQNPHMHLLEANLAAAEAFGDARFLARASELVGLFLERLFQPREGALPEYFDDALAVQLHDGRFLVEPGHHAEWVWLLHWFATSQAASGCAPAGDAAQRLARAAGQLAGFMDRHGVHPRSGALVDEVWSDGAPQGRDARLWPQTERLKAECLRADPQPARLLQAFAVLERFCAASPAGLWHERQLDNGDNPGIPAPASSLYHLTAGILVGESHIAKS